LAGALGVVPSPACGGGIGRGAREDSCRLPPPHPSPVNGGGSRPSSPRADRTSLEYILLPLFTQPFSFPRRVFAPGFLPRCFTHPDEGVAERRETYGCSDTRACSRRQAGALRRRLAYHDAGRPPPGALTVAILGSGAALFLTGICAGSVSELLAPGCNARRRLPLPPGAAGANRYRRTPRLAPHSGSSLNTPFDEQTEEHM